MRYFARLVLFAVLGATQQPSFSTQPPLSVAVTCRANPQCVFNGDDIYLDIAVVNQSDKDISLTTTFMRGTGADIKIIDVKSQDMHYSFASLGDYRLLGVYQLIPANGRTTMKTEVLTAYDLTRSRKNFVDLKLEVGYLGKWKIAEGKSAAFKEVGNVRIVGKDTLTQRIQDQ